jgi:hypothetical protein
VTSDAAILMGGSGAGGGGVLACCETLLFALSFVLLSIVVQ